MELRPDVEQLAQELRNEQSYDDFPYGMEPIPHDKTWVNLKIFLCSSNPEKSNEEG